MNSKRVYLYKFRGVLCMDDKGDLFVRNSNDKFIHINKAHNYDTLKRMWYKTRLTEIRVEVRFKSYVDQKFLLKHNRYVQEPFKIESVEKY